jgi:hypothetical protein
MNLSSKLGPRARTLASSRNHQIVDSLVEVAGSADLRNVTRALRKVGAHVFASAIASTTGFIRVEVAADHLNAVAGVSDVIYVEADDRS